METTWSESICDYGMVEINDIRVTEGLANDPALFFRKMALYLKNAIPMFGKPPEEKARLKGTEPKYDAYTCTVETAGEQTIETGKTGYELCSVEVIRLDKFGNPVSAPVEGASYDPETGTVTVPEGQTAGDRLDINFYTDGVFPVELSYSEKQILGLCLQYVWESRFAGDWLNRVPKPKGKSFEVPASAPQTRADTERLTFLKRQIDGKVRSYAQSIAYNNVVPQSLRLKIE